MESGKEIKRTTGEKIFGFLEKFSPEKLSAKFVCLLDNLSTEAAKEPLTERQRGFMEASENWLIGLVIVGFVYVVILLYII